MSFKILETIALDRDLPEHGLHKGDLGAVVHVYEPGVAEVEFVKPSGHTQALVTLRNSDVREIREEDLAALERQPTLG